eukprot:TRINITY_DN8705_c0_g2_i1.p1 TRINITY_DN8705_c0_g2~~TRINITY_DN8705_c0_g2_i1.p1  ORF type:complete len:543 (-),score=103.21 TRINITY_DN8705_c0_g2_i1:60-1688(-)
MQRGSAWADLFIRKPVDSPQPPAPSGQGLKRVITRYALLFFGIGSTVGCSVFVLTGEVIADYAGPAAVFSYLIAGIACSFSCLAYAEFACRLPSSSGSAYTYTYVSLGELVAWVVGWDLCLEYAVGASMVARGWAMYVVELVSDLFSYDLPAWLYEWGDYELCPIAAFLILFLAILVALGVHESATVNMLLVTVNVSALLFFCIFGGFHVDTANWSDFSPYGFTGVLKGSGVLFIAYIGFDAITCMTEECKSPAQDIPFAAISSLFISMSLFCAVALVLSGLVLYSELDSDAALASVFYDMGYNWAGDIVAICAVTTTTSHALCGLMSQPRIFYRMSADGLLFPVFRKINQTTRTPIFSVFFTAFISAAFALVFDMDTLSSMISIGALISFTIVCISILAFRYKSTSIIPWIAVYMGLSVVLSLVINLEYYVWSVIPFILLILLAITFNKFVSPLEEQLPVSHFLCPLVPFIPLAGIACNTVVLGTLSAWAWVRFACWFAVGMVIYTCYGYGHSFARRPYLLGSEGVQISAVSGEPSSTASS